MLSPAAPQEGRAGVVKKLQAGRRLTGSAAAAAGSRPCAHAAANRPSGEARRTASSNNLLVRSPPHTAYSASTITCLTFVALGVPPVVQVQCCVKPRAGTLLARRIRLLGVALVPQPRHCSRAGPLTPCWAQRRVCACADRVSVCAVSSWGKACCSGWEGRGDGQRAHQGRRCAALLCEFVSASAVCVFAFCRRCITCAYIISSITAAAGVSVQAAWEAAVAALERAAPVLVSQQSCGLIWLCWPPPGGGLPKVCPWC